MFHFTAILSDLNSSLWGGNIPIPHDIADQILKEQKNRRVVCTLNNSLRFQCALMPKGDGTYFILVNKGNRKKLGLSLGQQVTVTLEKDESEYGLPMPEEMAEVLASDPEGDELFQALTPGKQRNLLYIAGKVKSSELRIHKALVIVEHLKTQEGKIDFKQLNQELKASNRKF
jgi:mannitol/fructose-specific phosphotransferase system IIA component